MNVIVTRENGVATVTLNRPDKLNALSGEMYHELGDTFTALGADDAVRSVIVIGAGRAFCAGGDVSSMGGMGASEMKKIAAWIADVVDAPGDEKTIGRVRSEVVEMCASFPAPGLA